MLTRLNKLPKEQSLKSDQDEFIKFLTKLCHLHLSSGSLLRSQGNIFIAGALLSRFFQRSPSHKQK